MTNSCNSANGLRQFAGLTVALCVAATSCSRTGLIVDVVSPPIDTPVAPDVPDEPGEVPDSWVAVDVADAPTPLICRSNAACDDAVDCTIDECNFADGMCSHRLDLQRCECDPGCHVVVTGMGGRPFSDMGRTDVTLDLVVNGLVVRASEQVSDYLWVPNTGESTVSKWDAGLQREVARYRVGLFAGECPGSCCYTAGCNQVSRLVVDGFGNAYAANRGFSMQGTITKIAPDRAHCVDRNMNGVIDTSTGPMDLRPYGGDECVLWTAPVGQFDAVLRSITIDRGDALHPEGYPWIGGCVRTGALDGNAGLWQLNPLTGATLRHVPFEPCAYGAVTTPDGTIWEHTLSVGISPINPRTGRVGALIRTAEGLANTGGSYGITTDADGRIWLSRPSRDAVGYDPTTRQWARVDLMGLGPRAGSLGITVDPRNHVWVAGTNVAYEWSARAFRPGDIDPAQVTRHDFDNVGNLMAVSAIGADRRGRIWMASARPGPLVMLDPLTDRAEAFAGPNQVYTYSDFTGAVRRLTIGSGHYDELYNTDCDAQYDSFSWSADLPTGTSIQFVLRTALTEAGLVDATAVPIAVAPVDRPAVDVAARLLAAGVNPGQFARISATFNTTNDPVQSPILRSIQFSWRCR